MAPRQLAEWYFDHPRHPYVSGQGPMPAMPSTFTTPEECNAEFPEDEFFIFEICQGELIYMPQTALRRTPSLLREALANQEGRTRGLVKVDDVAKAVEEIAVSKEAFDVVFGCLLYGFIDVINVKCLETGGLQLYMDVDRDGADDGYLTAPLDLNHVVDSIILADAIGAPTVVSLLVRELKAEFDATIPTIDHIRKMMTVPWATGTFLAYWIFYWDNLGEKSSNGVKLHTERVEEAIKEVTGFADLARAYMEVWDVSEEVERIVKKALGMETKEKPVITKETQTPAGLKKTGAKKTKGAAVEEPVKAAKVPKSAAKASASLPLALMAKRKLPPAVAAQAKRDAHRGAGRTPQEQKAKLVKYTKKQAKPTPNHTMAAAKQVVEQTHEAEDKKVQERPATEGTREWAEGRRREVKKPAKPDN